MKIDVNKNRPIDNIAADIFHDVMQRMRLPHRWESPDTVQRRWIAVAMLVQELVAEAVAEAAPANAPSPELREEAEKMLRFVSGANLNSCELRLIREARERVYALKRALSGKK